MVLVFDDTGSLTNRFLHGPAVDQVFANEDEMGEIFWALADNQGTARDWAQYDSGSDTTTIANHLVFDAFGNITAIEDGSGNSASLDPQLENFLYAYTGRVWDGDADLYYYRARWYDPAVGRFISEDPIGFTAGDANLSRYVGNGPTNATDPSGLHELVRTLEVEFDTRPHGNGRGSTNFIAEGLDPDDAERFSELLARGLTLRTTITQLQAKVQAFERSRTHFFGLYKGSACHQELRLKARIKRLQKKLELVELHYNVVAQFDDVKVTGYRSSWHPADREASGTGFDKALDVYIFTLTPAPPERGLQRAAIQPGDLIPAGAIGKAGTKGVMRVVGRSTARNTGESFGSRCIGAAQRHLRTLQRGGNTIRNRTARGLNEFTGENLHRRDWGRALEGLKRDTGLPHNHHGRILENGDYVDDAGEAIGNLLDYLQ